MTDIQRIDYSKPPPGYTVRFEDSSGANGDGPPLWWYGAPHYLASMGSKAEALAAAWAHHKAHNDPPGILVTGDDEADAGAIGHAAWLVLNALGDDSYYDGYATTTEARVAAWVWFDLYIAAESPEVLRG